jgi:hypothetical protein
LDEYHFNKFGDGTGTSPNGFESEGFGAAVSGPDSGAFSVLDAPFAVSFFGGAGVGFCDSIVAAGVETPVADGDIINGSPQGPIGSR